MLLGGMRFLLTRVRGAIHVKNVIVRARSSWTAERFQDLQCKTHSCHELRSSHVGQEVVLSGWVQFVRSGRFLVVRDGIGSIQVILEENQLPSFPDMKKMSLESVVQIRGLVQRRPEGQENDVMAKDCVPRFSLKI
ncbi:unnamed protein product [Notodromas monacha]|uniref:OB domain-containing protein n=1 Tax=Notodromas monacha TaxID=399045 RepID=A0A7R9BMN0_9CRUS|nr:unnamed protein product [Notodromas monacha]CAG0916807.1 unnamed protein product [Notodromas monacha]